MTQISEFGKEAKKLMIDKNLSLTELAAKITETTGMFCDRSYLAKIYSGERNAPKIRAAIREILEMGEADGKT